MFAISKALILRIKTMNKFLQKFIYHITKIKESWKYCPLGIERIFLLLKYIFIPHANQMKRKNRYSNVIAKFIFDAKTVKDQIMIIYSTIPKVRDSKNSEVILLIRIIFLTQKQR